MSSGWLSDEIYWVDTDSITYVLEERQRQQDLDIGDLIPSVREKGILSPLWIEKEGLQLKAGWRRLTTARFLKMQKVPVRFCVPGLTAEQLQLLEWEENAKRKDLTWQDNARAQWNIHRLLSSKGEWSVEHTATFLSQSEGHTYLMLEIGEALANDDLGVKNADSQAQARTLLQRRRERAKGEALNRILEMETPHGNAGDLLLDAEQQSDEASAVDEVHDEATSESGSVSVPGGVQRNDRVLRPQRQVAPPYAIHHADAHEFLASYEGPKFNFLHCDLPYGVALNGQAAQAGFEGGGYESSPDIYWALCRTLRDNWQRFMFPSSHIMFWISMKFYRETIEFFDSDWVTGMRINPTPLIWHKTDNKGIIADHLRGPRNVYEAALLMSTGDRHIVKPVSNVYGCPTAKGDDAIHTNEKPEPMLRHFFQMFVDEHSRVLDPTCGSGSSIRVAEALGAEAALGLEFNPEFADRAQRKLVTARNLAALSGVVNSATANSALDLDL